MSCCRNIKNKQHKNIKVCPLCKELGDHIHYLVVTRLVKEDVAPQIREGVYFTCSNGSCDVVFYNEDEDRIILAQDINMAADFDEVTRSKSHQGNCNSKCSNCGE